MNLKQSITTLSSLVRIDISLPPVSTHSLCDITPPVHLQHPANWTRCTLNRFNIDFLKRLRVAWRRFKLDCDARVQASLSHAMKDEQTRKRWNKRITTFIFYIYIVQRRGTQPSPWTGRSGESCLFPEIYDTLEKGLLLNWKLIWQTCVCHREYWLTCWSNFDY